MKRFLSFSFLILFSYVLFAQVGEYRKDLAVGINGGYVLNKVGFNPSIPQSLKGGITIGGTLRYNCEKYFAVVCGIQTELNFMQMGWKEKIETSTDTYQHNVTYLQIPFLARIAYGRERQGVQGYMVLGPEIALCISDNDKRGGEWSAETLALRPGKITAQYNPIDRKLEYGITAGLGIEFSSRKAGHFQLEGRYHYGLSNIFKDSKKDFFTKSNNGAIIVKIAWLYDVVKTKNKTIK